MTIKAKLRGLTEVLRMLLHNEEPLGDGYAKVCTLDVEAARAAILARIDGSE